MEMCTIMGPAFSSAQTLEVRNVGLLMGSLNPDLDGRGWNVRIAVFKHFQKTLPKAFMDPRT